MTWRAAVHCALEALGVGDQDEAVAMLHAALESGCDDFDRLAECPECGLHEWPGLLAAHRRLVHSVELEDAA